MADANYKLILCKDESYSVAVNRTGTLPQMAAGFATEAAANAWIAQDERLWLAADPFRTLAYRRRQGL